MACTTLKVLDDCMMMCAHGFSFLKEEILFFEICEIKEDYKGASMQEQHTNIISKCSVLDSAPR